MDSIDLETGVIAKTASPEIRALRLLFRVNRICGRRSQKGDCFTEG